MARDNHNLSLNALAADPSLAVSLDTEERATVTLRCASVLAAISAAPGNDPVPHEGQDHDPILTVAEAAARLRYTKTHVYEMIRNKTIAAIRDGRTFRVRTSEIEKFLATHDTSAASQGRLIDLDPAPARHAGRRRGRR